MAVTETEDGPAKFALEEYITYIKNSGGWRLLEQEIKVCRLAKAWDSRKNVKMEISIKDGSKTEEVLKLLTEGFSRKTKKS